ncbi:MAG: MarR family winged helix-turn-helix transcriptional regulator [Maritimibacter sp.]|jgi:DNA-binding MarR family transcriptional regulator
MDQSDFASRFESLYRETYLRAVRRITDKRARLSPETSGLLMHLTATGPVTLTELARHTNRAQSTMSEMVAGLTRKGLLEVDPDPDDGRRHLIWLSAEGQTALTEALNVLDPAMLARGAEGLSAEERETFIELWTRMMRGFSQKDTSHD